MGMTPLQAALCYCTSVDVVRLVLGAGASPYALAFAGPGVSGKGLNAERRVLGHWCAAEAPPCVLSRLVLVVLLCWTSEFRG